MVIVCGRSCLYSYYCVFQEELAEGLHLIDFEQLKIENQTYNEKIEERNEVRMAHKNAASQTRENACAWVACIWVYSDQTPDWLRKRGVCADWLKYVARFSLTVLEALCTFAPWPFSRLAFALFTTLPSPYKTFCLRKLKIRQFHTKDYTNGHTLEFLPHAQFIWMVTH